MKDAWEVFADVYWESRRKNAHDMAIVDAVASFMFEMQRRKNVDANRGLSRLKFATDSWDRKGGGDLIDLRETLRHAWTDAMLT